MNKKEKSYIVGFLLDSMKIIDKEECRLADVGINYSTLGSLSNNFWVNIKFLTEMPLVEEEGKFVSDHWFDVVIDYLNGHIDRKTTVNKLIDWKNDFD